MKDKLVASLVKAFGSDSVRVNTEYHVQVRSYKSGWHDVWVNKDNNLSVRLNGKRGVKPCNSINDVISRIDSYNSARTDIVAMQEALHIGESIQHAQSVLMDRQLDKAIFVDAGFKNGKAKAAAIFITSGGDVDVRIRSIDIETSSQAELRAILLGMELRDEFGEFDTFIFTDCQALFEHETVKNAKNINWIPRIRNKGADRLSNLRSKSKVRI